MSTVLVVDDDADMRAAVAELLRMSDDEVMTAEHGAAALALLSGPVLPEVILLDLMMPVMDGLEFATARARDPRLAGIPLVIFSAGVLGSPPHG